MKVVIQKVLCSNVVVDGNVVGEIGKGLTILVGIKKDDTKDLIEMMVEKIVNLRIFEDDNYKMNYSVLDVEGEVLSISQFTLYANCKKGRRPSFLEAASGDEASLLYDYFNEILISKGLKVSKGVFGADMKLSIMNDGPCTIILDSENIF